ncbi:MAG: tetratricopeptide repeat protein [Candidatus Obscuribacterales bacterium]
MTIRNSFRIFTFALATSISVGSNLAWNMEASARSESDSISGLQIAANKTYQIRITRETVRADQLMMQGKFTEAADLYKGEMTRSPKSTAAAVGYGMALAKQFKLDAAEENFAKVLANDPMNAMAHAGKAMVMLNRLTSSSGTVIKNKDATLRSAEAEAKQAISIDPGMPEAHITLGNIYKEQGRLDDAINEYKEATHLDPKNSEAYGQMGIAKLNKENYADAVTAFKQAVSLNSGNSTAHYGLGRAYYKQGLYDEALKELNTSLYQNRNSAPVHQTMGDVYAAQGNTVAAVQQLQKSISIKPENPDAYLHIADIRQGRGDLEMSIAELRSGLEMMPNNPDLHLRVADQSLQLEKLDDAVKEYRTVLDANPQNSAAAKGLTRAYYLKANKEATGAFFVSNEYESAQRMIDQAVKMNPNDMELRLAQAKLRSMAGVPIDLASIGTPTNDGERVAYAEALLAQNKFSESDQQMNTVIANAADAKQTFAVGDLALMIKDLPSAEAAYKKAASFPGGEERAKRGLNLVAKQKDVARQELTLGDDLARRSQLASAIDKYHASIYDNPKIADSRMGIGKTLERLKPEASKDLKEAVVQYKAYMALTPNMPPKEVEKMNKKIANLSEKAYKLEQKEKERQRG